MHTTVVVSAHEENVTEQKFTEERERWSCYWTCKWVQTNWRKAVVGMLLVENWRQT